MGILKLYEARKYLKKAEKQLKEVEKELEEQNLIKILTWIGLFLNILVLPGSGTILSGKYLIGAIQLILYLAIIIIDVIYFGNLRVMMLMLVPGLIIWVWAMVTSIILIKRLKNRRTLIGDEQRIKKTLEKRRNKK